MLRKQAGGYKITGPRGRSDRKSLFSAEQYANTGFIKKKKNCHKDKEIENNLAPAGFKLGRVCVCVCVALHLECTNTQLTHLTVLLHNYSFQEGNIV